MIPDISWSAGAPAPDTPLSRVEGLLELRESPFGPDEFDARQQAAREELAARGLDAVAVFRPSSVEYVCGYVTGDRSPQPLLITPTDSWLFVPKAEVGSAATTAHGTHVVVGAPFFSLQDLALQMARRLAPDSRVGVGLGWRQAPAEFVSALVEQAAVCNDGHLVEDLRLVLSAAEQDLVRRAAEATEAGRLAALHAIREAASERDLVAEVTAALLRSGSAPAATNVILAHGPRRGVPHAPWTDRPLGDEPVFLEFAGSVHRYVAPVMMTISSRPLTGAEERLTALAQAMLRSVRRHLRAKVPACDVASAAAEELGYLGETLFHQVYGYPVGLAHPPTWMDGAPFYLTEDNPRPVRPGMTFHLPGTFRLLGEAGVGLSHTVIVQADGVEVLTGADAIVHVLDRPARLGGRDG